MSDSRYSYDENAEAWPYFAMTLLSLVLVPTTFKRLTKIARSPKESVSSGLESQYKPPSYDIISKSRRKSKQGKILTVTNVLLLLGWVIFFAVLYFVHSQESTEEVQLFDPYEILGIAYSATEKEVKSKYRKLSLKFHPDKIGRNLGNNTREELEAQYVDMTKAYKALTDEVTRKNYLEYGHPDGPQPTKQGVALPKWLVDEKGSPLVILSYALLVGVALPFVVWYWWSGTKQYTKNGLHTVTAADIFEKFAKTEFDNITDDVLLDLLANAEEFKVLYPGMTPEEVRNHLESYLNREEEKLEDEVKKLGIVARSKTILDGMLDIASSFKNVDLIKRILLLSQLFTQALPPGANELLQLPFIDKAKAESLEIKTIKELVAVSDDEQKKTLGIKSVEDFKILKSFESQIPQIEILKAFFKVPGEQVVMPGSLAHLVIKYRVSYPGTKLPAVDPKDLEEEDDAETLKKPLSTNNKAPLLESIYAPYLPVYIQPRWNVLLINPRENKIVEPPTAITRAYTDGKVSTFKVQLSAPLPDQLGRFRLLIELRSNSFVGADAMESVYLEISPPPTTEEEIEDDISDPDEDSIAGAMAMMKGGKTKRRAIEDSDEDADESSEEEEDSDTDINTDTEDEGDA
ncbi:hypothetical protein BZA70DRAFT_272937 [Myxozyma melibiosi]|uniref:J domain-containing protein n=1 Tax=Myxozyma melibiosi TaxID=54550 RepID=A0ABR1FED4_9ASCO